VDAIAGTDFDGLAVVERIGIEEGGLRVSLSQHLFGIGKQQTLIELELARIFQGQRLVGLGEAYDLDVWTMQGLGQESLDMSVGHTDDDHAKRGNCRSVGGASVSESAWPKHRQERN
jgi:hypothetical protein